jgi:hypothetical protein
MNGAVPLPLPASLPPAPPPGSARYFALLYAPGSRRLALARLLALADEIGTGVTRGLDHDVAHARLAWWQHEAEQYALGRAQHPWLRTGPDAQVDAARVDLDSLVQAAAIDLAQALRQPPGGERLRRAVFAAAAQVLGAGPLSPELRQSIGELGALSWQWEHLPSAAAVPCAASMQPVLARLGAALQPPLAPLLVWAALARRHGCSKKASMRHAFADNIHAWNVARRAAAGNFTSR